MGGARWRGAVRRRKSYMCDDKSIGLKSCIKVNDV